MAINFTLGAAAAASHGFWAVLSLSFVSTCFVNFLFHFLSDLVVI